MSVRIQCPACQRQFQVGEELKGRTVECGACETRFEVDDESIVKERERYFPGDIKKPGLQHYGRPPVEGKGEVPVRFATANYNQTAKAADVIPPPPQRTIASALGVAFQVLFAVILLVGVQGNGGLSEMDLEKRIILSGFVVLVGGSLLLYGAYRSRAKAVFGVVALGAIVMALAILLPKPVDQEGPDDVLAGGANGGGEEPDPGPGGEPTDPGDQELSEAEVMDSIGYEPVQKAMANFGEDAVVALWVPELKASFEYQIKRYLHRKTGTGERPSIYSRPPGGLIVIEGTPLSISEVERVVERFARVDQLYPNIRVLKISIQGERLVAPSTDLEAKLKDKDHGAFYRLNEDELNHIDLDRIREAAHRLAQVEPKSRRPQISARLVELLEEDSDPEFRATICDAIAVWSEPGDGAEEAVTGLAQELLLNNESVPRSMVQFLLARRSPETLTILEVLWQKDPSTWEPLLVDYGQEAEEMVRGHLGAEDRGLKRSAVTILRRVGSSASLPALKQALEAAQDDDEMGVVIQDTIDLLESERN